MDGPDTKYKLVIGDPLRKVVSRHGWDGGVYRVPTIDNIKSVNSGLGQALDERLWRHIL